MALISYQKKFIFVHIFKCGGTSMTNVLEPYCEPNPIEYISMKLFERFKLNLSLGRKLSYNVKSIVPHHPTASEIRDHVGPKIFNEFYKFAFVRNPFDLEVSLFHYMQKKKSHRLHETVKNMTFDQYIEFRVSKKRLTQSDYIIDQEGKWLVDFIGRFEKINSDFELVCNRLGIVSTLPHLNKSRDNDQLSYRQFFSAATKEMIEEAFADDLKNFNYEF